MRKRLIVLSLFIFIGLPVLGASVLAIAAAFAWPQLPSLNAITDYRPHIPLRVYTADGELIGEFGEERRTFVAVRNIPDNLKNAILAAEDDRFFEHSGVDFAGLIRATLENLAGGNKQGGSTITMQVARNFYLSRQQTVTRKLYEILLSMKIEQNLSKMQILELYINQIFLGQRAYGFAAAAETYYGKPLDQLSVAQTAMLAGLPKAPSRYNPVVNPKRATERQHYVLRRMHELHFIDDKTYASALQEPLHVLTKKSRIQEGKPTLHAEYVAEMARQLAYDQFKDAAYTSGLTVITTITKKDQEAAYESVRKGLLAYEQRHGYRGAEAHVDISGVQSDSDETLEDLIEPFPDLDDMQAAIVLEASPKLIRFYLRGGKTGEITGRNLRFPAQMMAKNAPPQKRIVPGSVIRVRQTGKSWQVVQPPEVESAFIALNPQDGAVRALVGGFDFNRNKFNHVTSAWRQPGSSFKPFIYSAAIDKGYTPGTVVDDSPISFPADATGSKSWNPSNDDGRYDGPISLRTALAKSKNVVAIRVLQSITPAYAQDYVTSRFGFDPAKNQPYLTLALGAGSVTPWQMASAYATFDNGGYRIYPYIVKEMRDINGNIIAKANPVEAGSKNSKRVLDPRNAFLVNMMLQDVVRRGTGYQAMSLGRQDLAGKTGTTNDYVDAWFCGYQASVVGIAWVGFDQPRKLGAGEFGSKLALPIWMDYMREALNGVPEQYMKMPSGLVQVRPTFDNEGPDYVYEEFLPKLEEMSANASQSDPADTPESGTPATPAPAVPDQTLN